jgi:hypothetical protein
MEVTRHYTSWQGTQIVTMLSAAMAVGLLVACAALYRAGRART